MNRSFLLCSYIRLLFGAFLLLLANQTALAANRTWVGPANGDWFTSNNWSPNDNWPQAGDIVAITNASIILTNSTAYLDTFSLTNATLFFTNLNASLQATNVFVRSNALMRHYPQIATTTNLSGGWDIDSRVYIVCSNLTVDVGGLINVDTNGFAGGPAGSKGCGPGGGTLSLGRGNGGSYGGSGGTGQNGGTPSPVYGSASAPSQPGSGGAAKSVTTNTTGIGGGLIMIQASGLVTINGTLSGTGGTGFGDSGGGGSGGGISINCGTLAGAGTISANGGTGASYGGPGGGGRIAIVYVPVAQATQNQTASPTIQFSPNYAPKTANGVSASRPGTVYLTDNSFLSSLRLQSCEFAGITNWALNSFTITNRWFIFPNFALTVTNDLMVGASGIFEISNSTVSVGGSLYVTNAAVINAYGGGTNSVGPDYGALIAVTNNLIVNSNGTVFLYSHPTNGGSVLIRASNVTVAAGGKFMADNTGFAGGYSGGVKGYGPGGSTNSSNSGGAGYGGAGGAGSVTPGGPTYGDPNAPILPGSGAGYAGNGAPFGGGLVRIDATGGKITLNGALSANGQFLSANNREGGGSGGGIFLKCQTLEGNGSMNANGGNGGYYGGGGGGGGRIAIWFMFSNYTGLASSTGGLKGAIASAPATNGANSATVWYRMPTPPVITNTAATALSYFSASMNATLVTTGTAPTYVSVFWGPTDQGTNKGSWPHTNDFPNPQTEGAALSTNISGLQSGFSYTYRYYASNSVGEAWAPLPTSFTTIAGVPVISNAASGATDVTLTSATLNGSLVSTGTAVTSLKVFWGPTDGGTNWGSWAHTNSFAGTQTAGLWSTNVSLGTPNLYYYYTFYATNSGGEVWATPSSPFIAGNVTLVATHANALENGPNNTGTFTVYRPATLTNLPLTVNYAISGTASNGADYQPISGSVVIPAGSSSNTITITPIMDAVFDSPNKWVMLTLAPGNYAIGSPSNDTVTIQDVAPAATNTFTGAGFWQSVTNWSDGIVPMTGQGVVINGSATLSNATADLSSLTVMSNKTLTFSTTNAIVFATDVSVAGTVTHNVNTATNSPWTMDNYVHIICTNLTVTSSGSIDVTGKGYQPPPVNTNGYGPGGGTLPFNRGNGGAYGGRGGGGQGATTLVGGYGSASAPLLPGSSGASANGYAGGAGGGLIRIEASGLVTVNGTLKATGGTGLEDSGGGGSGGGLYITCAAMAGSGTISANGGTSSSYGGPGGGGRVAIAFDPVAQSNQNQTASPTVSFGVNPGTMGANSALSAWPGSLYLPNNSFLSPASLQSCEFAGITNFAPSSATLTGKWWVTTSGFLLSVSNSLTIGAAGRLDLSNGVLQVGGDLILTNSATLVTKSGVLSNSALVNVTGLMYVGSNCTVYPYCDPTNGTAPLFTMQNFTLATGGTINADGKGYATSLGTGHGTYGSGGGYGGPGGQELFSINHYVGGITYGSSNAPIDPGSGGGRVVNDAFGGGLVLITASGLVQLDGLITANGQTDTGGDRSGGGSGGGIYVRCHHFIGSGSLSANGANTANWSGGGGGGGRIAVWMYDPLHTITATANGGIGKDNNGLNGTIVFGLRPAQGTYLLIQ